MYLQNHNDKGYNILKERHENIETIRNSETKANLKAFKLLTFPVPLSFKQRKIKK